jgi:hypothetical protein
VSTATRGRAYEHKVRDDLRAMRWIQIMRSAGSKGAADLLMAHPDHGPVLIQVGSKSKTLGPADRDRLCAAAELCGALSILAIVIPRNPVRYWLVTRDKPAAWDEWSAA